ncbi:peptidoglycan-binding domain-containing protein [Streptomyces sp. NPDC020362]|uniref:peptidoglycan-binding domain-containing protein n=1 Tax=unclassified Streptomyces TaxID=2593676 RepID=UPI0033D7CF44
MPTPPDPEEPHSGPVLEPVRVVRLRRFDALAELMREMRPEPEAYESFPSPSSAPSPSSFPSLPPSSPPSSSSVPSSPDTGTPWAPHADEEETQELPPFAGTPPATGRPAPANPGSGDGLRKAAVAVAVGAAALVGFGCALLLPGRQEAGATAGPSRPATTAPPVTAPAAPATTPGTGPSADPDGAGTLRQGDTGPAVVDLQQRLLRVPDVYRDGSTNGTYDAVLTAAVARFQLWYGISGDETGVYGNDTRRALESRTSLADGG